VGAMLQGKVAVVTGAGRGIGRGVALALAAAGAKVVVNDYGVDLHGQAPTAGPAFDVVAEIAHAGGAAAGDAVANSDSVATWSGGANIINTAVQRFGHIDILVTCAGILRDRMIFNMSEDDFNSVLAVHLQGTFNCIRHAAPLMRQQRSGRIITFSSGSGLFGNPGQANYGSAKAAISGLTKVVARDLGQYGVTCNSICPVAATRMTLTDEVIKARELRKQQGIIREERALAQLEDLKPEDVAPMVVFLASDYAATVNGQFFLCAGASISLVSLPRAVKTIFKPDARWTLDELDDVVPVTLAEGLVNPAPART
jgi:NAD(P)-dependent dehydrogenase (short-subunit alcohol dehydrogenase family)